MKLLCAQCDSALYFIPAQNQLMVHFVILIGTCTEKCTANHNWPILAKVNRQENKTGHLGPRGEFYNWDPTQGLTFLRRLLRSIPLLVFRLTRKSAFHSVHGSRIRSSLMFPFPTQKVLLTETLPRISLLDLQISISY